MERFADKDGHEVDRDEVIFGELQSISFAANMNNTNGCALYRDGGENHARLCTIQTRRYRSIRQRCARAQQRPGRRQNVGKAFAVCEDVICRVKRRRVTIPIRANYTAVVVI